jgi:hypothetical protein
VSQKRSDQFSYNPLLPGTSWPTGNTISLTAGESYYIEVAHRQGEGGQSAAVTYKFAGDPDPVDGTSTVITNDLISAISAPDTLFPLPVPHIAMSVSGSNLILFGSNGRANNMYDIVSSDDLTTPPESWTVEEIGFLDVAGNFWSITNIVDSTVFYRMRLLE